MHKFKFSAMFMLLMAVIFMHPLVESTIKNASIYSLLAIFALLTGVFIITKRNLERGLMIFLGFQAAITTVAQLVNNANTYTYGIQLISFIPFFIGLLFTVFRYLFRASRVTLDEALGLCSGYIIMGLMWSVTFMATQLLTGNAFQFSTVVAEGRLIDWPDILYYCFGTLGGFNSGFIVASSALSKALTMVASTTGLVYLAISTAFLVTLYNKPHRVSKH